VGTQNLRVHPDNFLNNIVRKMYPVFAYVTFCPFYKFNVWLLFKSNGFEFPTNTAFLLVLNGAVVIRRFKLDSWILFGGFDVDGPGLTDGCTMVFVPYSFSMFLLILSQPWIKTTFMKIVLSWTTVLKVFTWSYLPYRNKDTPFWMGKKCSAKFEGKKLFYYLIIFFELCIWKW
jgi:hypothetical protein